MVSGFAIGWRSVAKKMDTDELSMPIRRAPSEGRGFAPTFFGGVFFAGAFFAGAFFTTNFPAGAPFAGAFFAGAFAWAFFGAAFFAGGCSVRGLCFDLPR